MSDTTTPTGTVGPVLNDGRLYFAADRILCNQCAGTTALYTGRTHDHHRLIPVTAQDVADWSSVTDLPLTCSCGRLQAANNSTE